MNLDELTALEAKATPGKWFVEDTHLVMDEYRLLVIATGGGDPEWAERDGANAALIAAARNALPALLEVARAAQALHEYEDHRGGATTVVSLPDLLVLRAALAPFTKEDSDG